jgi:RNA methyltransferase, TrmH family
MAQRLPSWLRQRNRPSESVTALAPLGPVVTSSRNPHAKYARALNRRQTRSQERAFLVEGVRAVAEALTSQAVPSLVFFAETTTNPRVTDLALAASEHGARVFPTNDLVIRSLSDTEHPQGIIAVFRVPELEIHVPPRTEPLFVVADAIRDPGNLGTLIRSTLGAGAHALFVTPQTVDPFNPKVVRAGMSAHFRLPIRVCTWHQIEEPLFACEQRLAAETHAPRTYDAVDWTLASAIIVGNESVGISDEARALATGSISIPLYGELDSLNAGIAGSVILFEAASHRRARNLRS